jgi:hypothetical protein
MARALADVAHYLLPAAPPAAATAARVAVPLAPRDLARQALLWNLAVESARQGVPTALVAPPPEGCQPWPAAGRGPLGVEVVECPGGGLAALADAAHRAAARAGARSAAPPRVMVAVPPAELRDAGGAADLLRRVLLLVRPGERERVETWDVLEAIAEQVPEARIGACVIGVRSLADARRTFEGLAALAERKLGRTLTSYGVLIDDVQLSRSIVSQRPIALAQPASSAARALADVAAMLRADAREEEPVGDPEP